MSGRIEAGLVSMLLAALAGCGERSAATSTAEGPESATAAAQPDAQASGGSVAAAHSGGNFLAEPEGIEAQIAIDIQWSATNVTGIPDEGLTTTVYQHTAHLDCPITSGAEAPHSYFAALDNPNGDVLAATGSYQPWWNEECTGSLTVNDTYHQDDPTLAGPEPVIPTTGTRPLTTADAPLTIETDLNRARTRYLFITPDADGFVRAGEPGRGPSLVRASAAPMATLDFTLEGPIGGGEREIAVPGGKVRVRWTLTRGRNPR
jgi:hypothetical protein